MARSQEPANGGDHPSQNGIKGKQVAIALFIATTFGIMAILFFPLSQVGLPRPFQAALSPFEQLIRPVVPWLGNLGKRPPRVAGAVPRRPGGSVPQPSGPSGPGGPGIPGGPGTAPAPPPPAPPPPPPGEESPTLPPRVTNPPMTTLTKPSAGLRPTLVKHLRGVCRAERDCAKLLKRLEKLLRKLETHDRRDGKGRHRPRKAGSSDEAFRSSPGSSNGRGHGEGRAKLGTRDRSDDRRRSQKKQKKQKKHRKHQGNHQVHRRTKG